MDNFDPNSPAYVEYRDKAKELEAEIKAEGGDPEAFMPSEDDSSDSSNSSDDGPDLPDPDLADPPMTSGEMETLVADAISGAAALVNPDGSRVVVDQGEYEPDGWLTDLVDWISNDAWNNPEDQAALASVRGESGSNPSDGPVGGDGNGSYSGNSDESDGDGSTAGGCHDHTADGDVTLCQN